MKYGLVTIERAAANGWLGRCRVRFFGEDVTNRCLSLNDETGEIALYVEGADGFFVDDSGEQVRTRHYRHDGAVVFEVLSQP